MLLGAWGIEGLDQEMQGSKDVSEVIFEQSAYFESGVESLHVENVAFPSKLSSICK